MITKNKLERLMFNRHYNEVAKINTMVASIYNIPGKFHSTHYINRKRYFGGLGYAYLLVTKLEIPNELPVFEIREVIMSEDLSAWYCDNKGNAIATCRSNEQLKQFIKQYKQQIKTNGN